MLPPKKRLSLSILKLDPFPPISLVHVKLDVLHCCSMQKQQMSFFKIHKFLLLQLLNLPLHLFLINPRYHQQNHLRRFHLLHQPIIPLPLFLLSSLKILCPSPISLSFAISFHIFTQRNSLIYSRELVRLVALILSTTQNRFSFHQK